MLTLFPGREAVFLLKNYKFSALMSTEELESKRAEIQEKMRELDALHGAPVGEYIDRKTREKAGLLDRYKGTCERKN